MNGTHYAVDYFLRVYGGFILFAGIPANIICIIVLATDTTNRVTTRTFMVLLAAADCLVLITAVGRYWLSRVVGVHLRDYHPAVCKIHHNLVAIFSDFAVGMLCSLAVERFLVVAFPHNASNVVTKKSIIIGLCIFLIFVISKNSLHFYIFDILPTNVTSTIVYKCKIVPSKVEATKIFLKVDFITYSVIPYCVLFFCNVYLYLALRRQGRILNKCKQRYRAEAASNCAPNEIEDPNSKKTMLPGKSNAGPAPRKKRRPQSVIKVLVALSVLHFVTTLPGTTVTFMKVYIGAKNNANLRMVQEGLLLLLFTNNAINIIAYFASSRSFRKRCLTIFCHRFGFFKPREETHVERTRPQPTGHQTNGRQMTNTAMVTML